ncbi:MAG: hypothetical protein K5694_02380 [Bacilli bacterium]|nr:hypothetical protein [Bacilli bacterium]
MEKEKKKQKPKRIGQENNLPENRWQLLGDCLRFRFFDIVGVSLLTTLFYLPSIFWIIFCSYQTELFKVDNVPMVALEYGINAILLMIAGLGMGGLFNYFKKMVFGEGATLPGDFFEGLKNNAKQFLGIYFIIGLLYAVLRVDICALTFGSGFDAVLLGVFEGLSYAAFFIFLLALFFAQTQAIIYKDSVMKFFWNGIRFIFGAILTNIPMFIVTFLPFLVYEFVPFNVATYISIAIMAVFYMGFMGLVFTEYSYYLFDKSINKNAFQSIYRKGLRKEIKKEESLPFDKFDN